MTPDHANQATQGDQEVISDRERITELALDVARAGSGEDIIIYDDASIEPVEGGVWIEAYIFVADDLATQG